MRRLSVMLAVLLILVPGATGFAQITTFTAFLNIDNARPLVAAGTPASAQGMAVLVLSADRTALAYSITYTGLSGPPANAHFHRAAIGQAGGVVRTIMGGPVVPEAPAEALPGTSGTISGVWRRTDQQPFTAELLAALLAGELYINVHTAMNRGGETREQIMP
ncbi:MAG: CHRD domain-containing protein [Spirochaetaceae bacterium]|nr:MAG: CHRD domain-containing protein [Spirochaetaceae bacterium]